MVFFSNPLRGPRQGTSFSQPPSSYCYPCLPCPTCTFHLSILETLTFCCHVWYAISCSLVSLCIADLFCPFGKSYILVLRSVASHDIELFAIYLIYRLSVLIQFSTRDAFIRTSRCAIAMMFVRQSACLSLRLDSPMFWAPWQWHQSMSTCSQSFFFSYTWKKLGVWTCKLCVISQERLKIEVK